MLQYWYSHIFALVDLLMVFHACCGGAFMWCFQVANLTGAATISSYSWCSKSHDGEIQLTQSCKHANFFFIIFLSLHAYPNRIFAMTMNTLSCWNDMLLKSCDYLSQETYCSREYFKSASINELICFEVCCAVIFIRMFYVYEIWVQSVV